VRKAVVVNEPANVGRREPDSEILLDDATQELGARKAGGEEAEEVALQRVRDEYKVRVSNNEQAHSEYVSEALNVGLRTVEQYLFIVRAGGPNALDNLRARGHEPTLDSRQPERLRSALERGPRAHGYTSELWKNGDVQALIKKKLGVCQSSGYVRELVEKLQLAPLMQPRRRRTEKKRLKLNDEALAWVVATLRK
jgi:transposase